MNRERKREKLFSNRSKKNAAHIYIQIVTTKINWFRIRVVAHNKSTINCAFSEHIFNMRSVCKCHHIPFSRTSMDLVECKYSAVASNVKNVSYLVA